MTDEERAQKVRELTLSILSTTRDVNIELAEVEVCKQKLSKMISDIEVEVAVSILSEKEDKTVEALDRVNSMNKEFLKIMRSCKVQFTKLVESHGG